MQPIDYMRSAALLLAFGVTVSKDVKTWLLADFVATAVFGLGWFLLPDGLLGYQVSSDAKLDVVHQYNTQMFGVMMLCLAVIWYECRRSPDPNVTNTLLLSKVLGLTALLMSMVYAQLKYRTHKQRFSEQHLSFGIFGCSLWLLGNLYHLVRSPAFGRFSDAPNNLVNKMLLINAFIGFLSFFWLFGFPEYTKEYIMLKNFTLDGIHVHMYRALACLLFITSLVSVRAIYFRDDADKRAVFLAMIVMYAISLPTFCLHQYHFGTYNMHKLTWGASLDVPYLIVNILGYYYTR